MNELVLFVSSDTPWRMADLGAHWLARRALLIAAAVMAKSPEVKLAMFGRAGVGKSGKELRVCVYLRGCEFLQKRQIHSLFLSASGLRAALCVSGWPLLSNVFLSHPVGLSHNVCVVNGTVGGCFWSGLNTFPPTDKSVKSLPLGCSIPL